MLGVELVRNAGRIVKALRFDQNDLQLGLALMFTTLLLCCLISCCWVYSCAAAAPCAGENILFSVIYIGIRFGVDDRACFLKLPSMDMVVKLL